MKLLQYLSPSRRLVKINDQKLVTPSKTKKYITIAIALVIFLYILKAIQINFDHLDVLSGLLEGITNFDPMWIGAQEFTITDTFLSALKLLWSTITYSLSGTMVGIAISIPLSFLASKKIMKFAIIWWPVKTIVSIIRSIPPIIYAFIFSYLFDYSLAAMVSLALFVSVIMTKWMAEELDSMDLGPYETLISFGNKKLHAIKHGIMPSFTKRVISYGMYAFEMVLRFATILSFVGIPTIGNMLSGAYTNPGNWGHLIVSLSVLICTVIAIEFASSKIKKHILERQEKQIEIVSSTKEEMIIEAYNKKPKNWILSTSILTALLVMFVISMRGIEFSINDGVKMELFKEGIHNLLNPDWTIITEFDTGINAIQLGFEVVLIAIASVILGTILGVFFGILASKNITNTPIALFFKLFIIITRTIPTFVYALICVLIIAYLSPFAAVLAMGIRSIGMLGKLTYEKIESIDMGGKQSMEVSGNNVWNTTRLAVISEALPTIISNSLYRVEINFKSITDIGVVGASTFGVQIIFYSGSPNSWNLLTPYVVVMVAFVLIIEQISNALRKKVTDGHFFSQENFFKKMYIKNIERRNLAVASMGYSQLGYSQMTQNYDYINSMNTDPEFKMKLNNQKKVISETERELVSKYIVEYNEKIVELNYSITDENRSKVSKIAKDIKKNKRRYAANKADIKVKELFT